MKGSPVTKALALILLAGVAYLFYAIFNSFLPPLWAIVAGVSTPMLILIALGTLFDDGKSKTNKK